jgi:large repetitive protein
MPRVPLLRILIVLVAVGVAASIIMLASREDVQPKGTSAAKEPKERRRAARRAAAAAVTGDKATGLRGVVTGPSGEPIAGALVAAVPSGGDGDRRVQGGAASITETDEQGKFAIGGLRAGHYDVSATHARFAGTSAAVVHRPKPGQLEELRLTLGPRGATLRGTVKSLRDGKLEGAQVRAYQETSRGGTVSLAETDEEGHFEVSLSYGLWYVKFEAEGCATEQEPIVMRGDQEVAMVLRPGFKLRGVAVQGEDKAPVPHAEVTATRDDVSSSAVADLNALTTTVIADELGRFELSGLPLAAFRLRARKDGLAGFTRAPVTSSKDQQGDAVTLELVDGLSLTGKVVDAKGAGVSGAQVVAAEVLGVDAQRISARTDKAGGFEIRGIMPGRFVVRASAEGRADAQAEVQVGAGSATPRLSLRLGRGAVVHGRVTTSAGRPAEGATIRAFVKSASAEGRVGVLSETVQAGADGRYTVTGLGEGQLTVEAFHSEHGLGRASAQVVSGTDQQLDVPLRRGSYVEGIVVSTEGEPLRQVFVQSTSVKGGARIRGMTSQGGTFRLGPFADPDMLTITASRNQGSGVGQFYSRRTRPSLFVTVDGKADVKGTKIILYDTKQRIEGQVRGPDGQPLAGAYVSLSQGQPPGRDRFITGLEGTGAPETYSRDGGTFALEGVWSGVFTVYARYPGLVTATANSVTGDSFGVALELGRPGSVSGTVVGEKGEPVTGCSVIAVAAKERAPQTQNAKEGQRGEAALARGTTMVRARSGEFSLHGLESGEYVLFVEHDGRRVGTSGNIFVKPGEAVKGVRISLRDGVLVQGRLVDFFTGQPVANALVRVAGPGSPTILVSRQDGSFVANGAPPDWRITVDVDPGASGHLFERRMALTPAQGALDLGMVRLLKNDWPHRSRNPWGVMMSSDDRGDLRVGAVRRQSPAQKAGLQPGDRVLSIQGQSMKGALVNGAMFLLEGQPGEKGVSLEILPAPGPGKTPPGAARTAWMYVD